MDSLARRAGLAAALLAVAGTLIGGCASQQHRSSKVKEGDLLGMLAVFPGRYDNTAQTEQEASSGARRPHDAVALTITHVLTPRLGKYVYYAQETAADDPRRVLSQRMYSFQIVEKRGIVETVYAFIEPLRWRDGQLNKDVFTSVDIDDVQGEACQLLWKKKDQRYIATHDPKICPDPGGGAPVTQAELSPGELTIGDYKFRKSP
jgi:hypothetical protein